MILPWLKLWLGGMPCHPILLHFKLWSDLYKTFIVCAIKKLLTHSLVQLCDWQFVRRWESCQNLSKTMKSYVKNGRKQRRTETNTSACQAFRLHFIMVKVCQFLLTTKPTQPYLPESGWRYIQLNERMGSHSHDSLVRVDLFLTPVWVRWLIAIIVPVNLITQPVVGIAWAIMHYNLPKNSFDSIESGFEFWMTSVFNATNNNRGK